MSVRLAPLSEVPLWFFTVTAIDPVGITTVAAVVVPEVTATPVVVPVAPLLVAEIE